MGKQDASDGDFADVALAVLAGGEGTRMGRPKAWLTLSGKPILLALLERLDWPGPTLLVTASGRDHPPGWERFTREVSDPVAGEGPLRGLLTAFENSRSPFVVMTAVDMPLVRREQLAWLTTALRARPEVLGIMMVRNARSSEPQVEPFPSAFRAGAAPLVRARLAAGNKALHRLAEDESVLGLPAPSEWPAEVWTNLNRPQDLEAMP